MENDQEKLRLHLIQLRKELMRVKQLLHDSDVRFKAVVKECRKGFQTISDTGNIRVADVFLGGLEEDGFTEDNH